MAFGIIAKKIGMTQIFTDDGEQAAVTVVQAGPCTVLDIRDKARDGYTALRLGYGTRSEHRLNKPEAGYFKKSGQTPCAIIREFRMDDQSVSAFKPGETIDASKFNAKDFVDVCGISKGKGFQGVQKRHKMSGGPGAHGSHFGREPGSTGNREKPGRVFKNKRMPGRMGRERVTVQSLEVLRVDAEKNLLFIRGAVPGINDGWITVSKAVKSIKKKG
jgi:large subunit ribosomal protein L3